MPHSPINPSTHKPSSVRENILGSAISFPESYRDAYEKIRDLALRENTSGYITVNNVHTVVEGVLHSDYQQITNNALMALPDGKPLSVVAKKRGIVHATRIFGPTFFEKALEMGQADNIRHFFFGSSPEVLEQMQVQCAKRFPDATIVGAISPPFRPLTAEENTGFIDEINRSNADIIWVGLGAPRQEYWMAQHARLLNKGVMIGVGAGFDYLAGNTQHAPEWMKNASLEWLYRLIQEPGRLWKRYVVTNSLFLIYIFLEQLGLKKF